MFTIFNSHSNRVYEKLRCRWHSTNEIMAGKWNVGKNKGGIHNYMVLSWLCFVFLLSIHCKGYATFIRESVLPDEFMLFFASFFLSCTFFFFPSLFFLFSFCSFYAHFIYFSIISISFALAIVIYVCIYSLRIFFTLVRSLHLRKNILSSNNEKYCTAVIGTLFSCV